MSEVLTMYPLSEKQRTLVLRLRFFLLMVQCKEKKIYTF